MAPHGTENRDEIEARSGQTKESEMTTLPPKGRAASGSPSPAPCEAVLADLSMEPAQTLYRFFNADGQLLYIGVTGNVRARWNAHSLTQPWWTEVATCTIEHRPSRAVALAAEKAAIVAEQPLHNVVHNQAELGQKVAALRGRPVAECAPIIADLLDDLTAVATDERYGDEAAVKLLARALRAIRPRMPRPADRATAIAELHRAVGEGARNEGRPSENVTARTIRASDDSWRAVDSYASAQRISESKAAARILAAGLHYLGLDGALPCAS